MRRKPYPGTLILFRGRGLYEDDPNMGWEGLAATLENYEIGERRLRSRRDIMNEPLVGLLATQLDGCMAKNRWRTRIRARIGCDKPGGIGGRKRAGRQFNWPTIGRCCG